MLLFLHLMLSSPISGVGNGGSVCDLGFVWDILTALGLLHLRIPISDPGLQRENEEMEQVLRAEAAEAQAMREAMENSEDGAVRSNAELQSAMEALMLRARRAQDVTRSASDGPKLASTADPRKLIAMSQAPKATGGRAVPDSSEPRRDYPPKPQVRLARFRGDRCRATIRR